MSGNAVESSGQRFLGWINRQQQRPGETVSVGASNATGARELAKAEQLKVWEDEGGALADRSARGRVVSSASSASSGSEALMLSTPRSRHSPVDQVDPGQPRPDGTAVAQQMGWTPDSLAAEESRSGAGVWRRWCDFPRREQTHAEELANTVSHGIGLVAALVGIPFLLATVARYGDLLNTIGAIVFSACVVALYFSSTVYHGLPNGNAKRVFRVVEHSAIYLLIAGTYTPFALGVLRGPWGWTLLGAVWTFAAIGVALKAFNMASHPILSTSLYLLMGWLIVLAAEPLMAGLATPALLLLIAGGLSYTVGVIFFALDSRLSFGHLVWHAFVMIGTACHYFAVLLHAA